MHQLLRARSGHRFHGAGHVGDPRQLHAVGRGGMFDELCCTGRAHELATIHRFRHACTDGRRRRTRRPRR
ncbi:MAG: AAA family ATPase [Actinobacteria bacterium]|nr:AAA family ATPase [Actinomycetota bacterium]